MRFGEWLFHTRIKAGVSSVELAEAIGVSPKFLLELEEGTKNPILSLSAINKMAEVLKIDISVVQQQIKEALSWIEYFKGITELVAQKSTCLRRKVGAIAVCDKRILATGYNGAPSGMKHCAETGCLRQKLNIPSGQRHEICRGVHAEQNIIIQAALHGVSLNHADIYCTNMPCVQCLKMLVNCNIANVYYMEDYSDPLAEEMLHESNINFYKV